MSHSRRRTDRMNPISKVATNYAGIVIPIIAGIIIAISVTVINLWADVQVGKSVYVTSKDVNQIIIKFSEHQSLESEKKFDTLYRKIDLLTSEIQKMSISMARIEEKVGDLSMRVASLEEYIRR